MAGNNEISTNLFQIAINLHSNLAEAMGKACAIVRNDAVKNAPHDTGTLQRSIDFEVSDDGTEGVIFSNLDYAPYVECGTGVYATKGQGRDTSWRYPYYYGGGEGWATTTGQKAQPFLEPALTQNTSKIKECFGGLLENEKL